MSTITISTRRSAKGNSFLIIENNRFHPAGSSTYLTSDDVKALLANVAALQAFVDSQQPVVRVMPAPSPVIATPVTTPIEESPSQQPVPPPIVVMPSPRAQAQTDITANVHPKVSALVTRIMTKMKPSGGRFNPAAGQ